MSPKLVLACFVGVGGSAGVYGIYQYNQFNNNTINVKKVSDNQEVPKTTSICKQPTYQATSPLDNEVKYYICDDITVPTSGTTTTEITATVDIEHNHTFHQTKYVVATSPESTSTQWTYSKNNNTTSIDFHWLQEAPSQTTFFIKKPQEAKPPFTLTTPEEIKSLVEIMEILRKRRIITIETTAASTAKVIDSISCVSPKQLTNNQTKGVEYYSCSSITGAENGTGDVPTATAGQTTFQPNEEFKTKTTTTHKTTKWSKKDVTDSYFLRFKHSTDNTKPISFFIHITATDTDNKQVTDMVLKIEEFILLQTT